MKTISEVINNLCLIGEDVFIKDKKQKYPLRLKWAARMNIMFDIDEFDIYVILGKIWDDPDRKYNANKYINELLILLPNK